MVYQQPAYVQIATGKRFVASDLPLVRTSDDFENHEYNEDITSVAQVWSEVLEIARTSAD